jgi:hypothetical protein
MGKTISCAIHKGVRIAYPYRSITDDRFFLYAGALEVRE